MSKNRSKSNKSKKKASAQPKVVKDSTAVSDSVINESKAFSKGLDLDDIKTVLDKDVEKAISHNYDELHSIFDSNEEFTINIEGKSKERKVRRLRVDPLPESAIMEALSTIWESNREDLIKQGFSKINASKVAGSSYEEFLPYLNVVVPDNYEPKNHRAKEAKSKGGDDWKLIAVNKEAINRKMKAFMAKGSLIIYRVQGKFHLVPTQCMVKNIDAYIGSIWHINQIRNILYNTKQWNQGTTPYISFFKPENPLGLPIKDFEKVLALDKSTLALLWTPTGFDTTKLHEALGVKA